MNEKEFVEACKKINIEITNEQLKQLDQFYHLMIEWNERINLTRITEEQDVYLKHYYDSLTLNKVVDLKEVKTLCDVGTGAGFPGIVLKIVFPNLKVTLIDSLQKRVNYLNEVIKELELKDIEAIHARGEDYKGQFDVVTSRAVANIEKLVGYTMHLVSKEGVFAAMKGNIEEELSPIVEKKLSRKYKIIKIERFSLPIENSTRTIILIKNV
ncbi:MAG: 16S rRNA (guanine(527)-N(7))-methyltransferase RsmG [Bacilli bacterium]|nr:16S rRNA (guanine(527)-N(7))-methyltransferase RsmG [Bacilli bacterium]